MREGMRRMEEGLLISYFFAHAVLLLWVNVYGNLGSDRKIIFRSADEGSDGGILTNSSSCFLSPSPENWVHIYALLGTADHSWMVTGLSEVTGTYFNFCFFQLSCCFRQGETRAIHGFPLTSSLLSPPCPILYHFTDFFFSLPPSGCICFSLDS